MYNQAEKYIKPKTNESNVIVAKNIVSKIKKTTKDSNMKTKVETSLKEIETKSIAVNNEKLTKKAKTIDFHEEIIDIKDSKYKLRLELITEPAISDLYSLLVEEDELFARKISYKINLAHPFFTRFEKMKGEENYQPIISIIKSLVLAEIVAQSQDTKNAGNVRINFNHFLRNL